MKSYLIILVSVAIFCIVFCSGCESSQTTDIVTSEEVKVTEVEEVVKAEPPVETIAEPNTVEVVVTVNGEIFNDADVDKMISFQVRQLKNRKSKLPAKLIEQRINRLRWQAIERLVRTKLLDEKAAEGNIQISEEDAMAFLMEQGARQRPPLNSLDDIKADIKKRGLSFEEVMQMVLSGLGHQKVIELEWEKKVNITEEDAKKYYDDNQRYFEKREQVRASHILIKPETSGGEVDPNEAKAVAKAKAEELLEQIKAGADFAELAREHSMDRSSKQGGDLGFRPRGAWVRPFDIEKIVFSLKVEQISDVVETKSGFHIIKVTGHKDASVTSFSEVKENIVKNLTKEKKMEVSAEFLESLKTAATIVYPEGKEPPKSAFRRGYRPKPGQQVR